jgi:hypothetical protein
VRELGAASDWLELIEREHALLIAIARKTSEERRDQRASADETLTPQEV